VEVVFENDNLVNTLGDVLAQNHKKQIRIAETEKYPHVTFFFNGGREVPFEGETRIMAASPKVATYDLQPEMSAEELTNKLLPEIQKGEADFICLNYANADMVGHTGIFSAVVKAVETVDTCVQKIVTAGLENGYTLLVTADHGNADFMINADGSPNTAHTLNLVPLFLIDKDGQGSIQSGKLGDVAPTILSIMGLPIPSEMTGNVLT
jgi:2,3-bisphosphoglycerate-independent phosphoglycerate mutase